MLLFLTPRIELSGYITKIWLFENSTGLPPNNLIAPNARPKIIISYRNSITTTDGSHSKTCRDGDIYLIGLRDKPVTLTTPRANTGSIGIELTTAGAYRLVPLSMLNLANDLFSFSDIYSTIGKELIERIGACDDAYQKIEMMQDFLLQQLRQLNKGNPIVDFAVDQLILSKGVIEIRQLEKKTGYSRRYLEMLFREHVGITPKTLSVIIRFQAFYKQLGTSFSSRESIYDLYYDDAHFIKECKRFTGHSPSRLMSLSNEFGKNF